MYLFFQYFILLGGEFTTTQTPSTPSIPSTTTAAVTSTATVPATTMVDPTTRVQTTTNGIIAANPSTMKIPSQVPNSTIATTAPISTIATTVPFSTIATTESVPTTTDLSTTSDIEGTMDYISHCTCLLSIIILKVIIISHVQVANTTLYCFIPSEQLAASCMQYYHEYYRLIKNIVETCRRSSPPPNPPLAVA